MKKILTLLLCICAASSSAQNYKWVKGGGGNNFITSSYKDEASYRLCTDKHGNIYSLNVVAKDMVGADTFFYQNFGAVTSVLITSYDCEGQMRWARFIKATPQTVRHIDMAVDTLGNVYVAVRKTTGSLYIDNDTVINMPNLFTALVQFDSNGNYNWVRFLGTDEPSNQASYVNYGALAVDGQQNLHFFAYVHSGVSLTTSIVSEHGVYDLVYDASGSLLNVVRLNMDSVWYLINVSLDNVTGRLYAVGLRDQTIIADGATFVAAYDTDRNMLWFDTTGNNNSKFNDIEYDHMGNLYVCVGHALYDFSFKNINIANSYNPIRGMGIILKMDTSSNVNWVYTVEAINSIPPLGSLTILPNGNITATGNMGGIIRHGVDSVISPVAEGQNPYFTIVDTAGGLVKLDHIHGMGFYDWGLAVTCDKYGNLYIGGQVEQNIWADTLTPYLSHGGNTDFFVMKYGFNCDCIAPEASYTFNVDLLSGEFIFNSTTTLIDSLVWTFGDGSSQTTTGTTTSHYYPNEDSSYIACVTIHNECGTATFCDTVHIASVGVSNIAAFPGVRVYPNPVSVVLYVDGITTIMQYTLYNATGSIVGKSSLQRGNNKVNMESLSQGIYLLELTNGEKRSVLKVVR